MALSPRLDLRQTQALVMTPQLQQAIKLLQLNNIELTAYVEQELERNPLLEREEGPGPDEPFGGDGDGGSDGEGGGEGGGEALEAIDFDKPEPAEMASDAGLDMDYDNLWNNDGGADQGGAGPAATGPDSAPAPAGGDLGGAGLGDTAFATWSSRGGGFDDPENSLEQMLSGEQTLRDHLQGQLGMEIQDPVERIIGLMLIEMLDEAGWLAGSCDDVALRLGCPAERVEAVLERMQQFDPPGIFARGLAECLAIQLREKDRLDPAMQALLENLDLLAKRDMAGLLKACGVDAEDMTEMVAELRALDPKPASAFDHDVAQPVTPDVLMRPKPDGGWIIELNADTLPRVLVNQTYYATVHKAARSKEDKQYVAECMQTANWLVKSLHQRATTILKVASEIVRQQDGFFAHGVKHLRPLVLRDIAQAIEMHESTVSRVTSNKYVATPRGIYELKYFFTQAIAGTQGGEAHSAESVRHRIKELIDEEPPKKILSDDKIVEILKKEGIDIARRTVAKYREAMGIPSSVRRRREKAAGL